MRLDIIEVNRETHDALFRNLYQFYLYDFSEMLEFPVEADGRYEEDDIDHLWRNPVGHGFLLKVNGELAGLAIVEEWTKDPTSAEAVINMDEFFVLRKFRRRGVGEGFARALFDKFPGRWRVAQVPENTAAQRFWRRVIGAYSNQQFEDSTWTHGTRSGPVQYFDTATHTTT